MVLRGAMLAAVIIDFRMVGLKGLSWARWTEVGVCVELKEFGQERFLLAAEARVDGLEVKLGTTRS